MRIIIILGSSFAGFALGSAWMWGEFFKRVEFAAGGGRGESALWGEPLFYILLLGTPCAVVGAIIGAALTRR